MDYKKNALKFAKWFDPIFKDDYCDFIQKAWELAIYPTCKENMKQVWKRSFLCEKDRKKAVIKAKSRARKFTIDMRDQRNWKATCDDCGWKMDFSGYGFHMWYICRKCGNVLEV